MSYFQDTASELLYPILPIFLTSVLGAPIGVTKAWAVDLVPVTSRGHALGWQGGELGIGSPNASAAKTITTYDPARLM